MLTKLDLRPLDGPDYQGRYWPLDDKQISTLETTIGRALPDSYRSFISTHGASATTEPWVIDGGSELGLLGFQQFLGAPPAGHDSILERATDYLEPLGLLVIIRGDTGYFYLAPNGSIIFERSGDPILHTVAASFEELLQRAFIDEI